MKAGSSCEPSFSELIAAIVAGDDRAALSMLDAEPALSKERAGSGATRQHAQPSFFEPIRHYIYAGDTALHMAAAAFRPGLVDALITKGAELRARNRRGAEPLHYAVDGGPGVPAWDPAAQAKIIARLIRAGADPNALDRSGVAPLHRAVRNRCADAVAALLAGRADPRAPTGKGSTPMRLAIGSSGKSGAGSEAAKAQQARIVQILRDHGATD
ncbi:MAG: ankyrin repeat domain-containing protein [Hyphomicrobiales bacterium]|nr:MAG: ankyrin repeat domain-containing protein [Hyphomicrobiales bacterium]